MASDNKKIDLFLAIIVKQVESGDTRLLCFTQADTCTRKENVLISVLSKIDVVSIYFLGLFTCFALWY